MEGLWLNFISIEASKKIIREVNKSKVRPVLKTLADILLLIQLSRLVNFAYKNGKLFQYFKLSEIKL